MDDPGPHAHRVFPCSQCGAKMVYDPALGAQQCPYCGHENAVPPADEPVEELDYRAFLEQAASEEPAQDVDSVSCTQCGANYTLDPHVTSASCPFCGFNVVTPGASRRTIRPKALLPFRVTRKEALEAFRQWLNDLWFAPNRLRRTAQAEDRLCGMYVPYWTYDSSCTSQYEGERGDDYWVTESYWTTENGRRVRRTRQVRRTRWTRVRGVVRNNFDDVLVLASHSLPHRYTDRLEPWDLQNLEPYRDEYLSGFRAESYQIDLAQGFELARGIMDQRIEESIRRDIGGDRQRIHRVRTRYDDITFKHILLPIWISVYRYRDKPYRFLVNGRTGEVQGERPWSAIKIALTLLALVALAGCVVFLLEGA